MIEFGHGVYIFLWSRGDMLGKRANIREMGIVGESQLVCDLRNAVARVEQQQRGPLATLCPGEHGGDEPDLSGDRFQRQAATDRSGDHWRTLRHAASGAALILFTREACDDRLGREIRLL